MGKNSNSIPRQINQPVHKSMKRAYGLLHLKLDAPGQRFVAETSLKTKKYTAYQHCDSQWEQMLLVLSNQKLLDADREPKAEYTSARTDDRTGAVPEVLAAPR